MTDHALAPQIENHLLCINKIYQSRHSNRHICFQKVYSEIMACRERATNYEYGPMAYNFYGPVRH